MAVGGFQNPAHVIRPRSLRQETNIERLLPGGPRHGVPSHTVARRRAFRSDRHHSRSLSSLRHRGPKYCFCSGHSPKAGDSVQAAARFVVRRACLGGGMSRSAGTRNRARKRCTMAMLNSFLPLKTSLTRLGVPRIGTISARLTPCWSIRCRISSAVLGARRGHLLSS